MTRYENPMEDFKPVFQALRSRLAIYATIARERRLNARLNPGETMEARVAERSARLEPILAAWRTAGWFNECTVSMFLTAHRHLRGKPANHGIEDAAGVTERVVADLRKEIALVAETAKVAGLV